MLKRRRVDEMREHDLKVADDARSRRASNVNAPLLIARQQELVRHTAPGRGCDIVLTAAQAQAQPAQAPPGSSVLELPSQAQAANLLPSHLLPAPQAPPPVVSVQAQSQIVQAPPAEQDTQPMSSDQVESWLADEMEEQAAAASTAGSSVVAGEPGAQPIETIVQQARPARLRREPVVAAARRQQTPGPRRRRFGFPQPVPSANQLSFADYSAWRLVQQATQDQQAAQEPPAVQALVPGQAIDGPHAESAAAPSVQAAEPGAASIDIVGGATAIEPAVAIAAAGRVVCSACSKLVPSTCGERNPEGDCQCARCAICKETMLDPDTMTTLVCSHAA